MLRVLRNLSLNHRRYMSSATPITDTIRAKLTTALQPVRLDIANDSEHHAHHASMRGSTNVIESHFRLDIVSEAFDGKSKPARHRMVYELLAPEMKMANGIHALQLKTRTPAEAAN